MIKPANYDDGLNAWEEARNEIKRVVPCTSFLQKAKKSGYICPFCGSGSGPNGTGAQYYKDTNKLCCFSNCGNKTYDVIDIWGKVYNVDYKTAVEDLAELANILLPGSENGQKTTGNAQARTAADPIKKEAENTQNKPKTDYSAYFKECAERLGDPAALAYLSLRGISQDTARRFNLGFDPEADPANKPGAAAGTWKPHPAPRLIVPMGKYSFTGRRTDAGEEYKKTIAKDGNTGFTTPENFRNGTGAIFITEGAFDALAIMEAAPELRAISLNSTNNAGLLINSIAADKNAFINDNTGEYWPIIICLDNDNAGRQAQHFLLSELQALGLPCIAAGLEANPGEDPNDILVKYGKEEMKRRVHEAINSAWNTTAAGGSGSNNHDEPRPGAAGSEHQGSEPNAEGHSILPDKEAASAPAANLAESKGEVKEAAGNDGQGAPQSVNEAETGAPDPEPVKNPIDLFLEEIKNRRFEPVKTNLPEVDRALMGGFLRRTIVTLAAAPGMGKTAFCQQLFEGMAAAGTDVLFLNLEMDRAQLLGRSISRLAWRMSDKNSGGYDVLKVLRGYEWTPAQEYIFMQAIEEYRTRIAPHFSYNPDTLRGNDIDSIIDAMQAETERLKAAGRRDAPIICIDYLQLIMAPGSTTAESIQIILQRLKEFAINNSTAVVLVAAQNRAANMAGASEMESGRDTSGIEYTGDLMLGLVYTAIENKETWTYHYTDDKGNEKTKKQVYDLERIRELQRIAEEDRTPPDPVCNRISLKVLKNRFGSSQRRANFIFDGRHMTFYTAEREGKPVEEKSEKWEQADFSNMAELMNAEKPTTAQF